MPDGSSRPRTIDEYLANLQADQRAALEDLREVIRAAAPEATEAITYQIPTFRHEGNLVAFSAARSHCTFPVMSGSLLGRHADELKGYTMGKGSIQFTPGEPLPSSLVTMLVKGRIAENEAAAAKKR